MKFVFLSSFAIFLVQFNQISANSNHRAERQASNYEFPGVRTKAQYEELIEQYEPVARVAAAQTYSPSVADPQDYSGQSYSQPAYRAGSPAASRSRAPQYKPSEDNEEDAKRKAAEEEEEKKPDRLALLLQDSKFTCGEKKDGYYADETVGCQVFHYCIAGAKHSWQCPENTVFHQIHLNCVPNHQDICTQSSKYHIVNDYLYKPLEHRGPNNTVLYHQRFYPEGFDFGGDVLSQVLPPTQPKRPAASPYSSYDEEESYEPRGNTRSPDNYPSYQSYPASAPARAQTPSRPIYRTPVVRPSAPQTYNVPAYTTSSQPRTTSRPSTYSTPTQYSTSYSDSDSDSESNYDTYSSGNGYNPSPSSYSSSANSYSAPSSSYSAQSSNYPSSQSSGYSVPSSSYSGALSSYPSSSSGSSSPGSSAALSSYRPVQASRPVSYPSRPIGIPIASFRVSSNASPNYGSSAQASRVRSSAYPSPSSFSLGAFNREMASGVKYDEDY